MMGCEKQLKNGVKKLTSAATKKIAKYYVDSSGKWAANGFNDLRNDKITDKGLVAATFIGNDSNYSKARLQHSVPINVHSTKDYNGIDNTITVLGTNLYTGAKTQHTMDIVYGDQPILRSVNTLENGNKIYITDSVIVNEILSELPTGFTQTTMKLEATPGGNDSSVSHDSVNLLTKESVYSLLDEFSDGNTELKTVADELFGTKGMLTHIPVYHYSKATSTSADIQFNKNNRVRNISLYYNKYDDTGMDIGERYVHELVHAVLYPILESKSSLYTAQLTKLEELYDNVIDKITTDKLVSKGINAELANGMIEHINEGVNGFHEFLAYAKTNTAFREVLEEETTEVDKGNKNILQLINELLRRLFNYFSKNSKKQNVKDQIDRLVTEIIQIQSNTKKRSAFAIAFEKLGNVVDKLNTHAVAAIKLSEEKLSNRASKNLKELRSKLAIKKDGSVLDKVKLLASALAVLYSSSSKAKGVFTGILSSAGVKPSGIAKQMIDSFMDQDELANKVENLGMLSQQIDEQKQSVANLISNTVLEGFTKKLTWEQKEALTKELLHTDIQSLFDSYKSVTASNIQKVIDQESRNELIKATTNKLKTKLRNNEHRKYILDQIELLSEYMVNGTVNLQTLHNSLQIARGVNRDDKLDYYKDEDTVGLIDTLASLSALDKQLTENSTVATLLKDGEVEGIANIIRLQKEYSLNAGEKLFESDRFNMIKGYTKFLPDPNVDVVVKPLSDAKKLADEGYKLDHELANIVNGEAYGVFVNKLNPSVGFNKQAVRVIDSYRTGTSIDSLLKDELASGKISSYNEYLRKKEQVFGRIRSTSKNGLSPVYNADGNVVDYTIHMKRDVRDRLYNVDSRANNVLAGMYNTMIDKSLSREFNNELTKELVNYHKTETIDKKLISKDGYPLVAIGPKNVASNEDGYKIWKLLPEYMKKDLEEQCADELGIFRGIKVRADLLRPWFGEHDIQLTDSMSKTSTKVQHTLRMAGTIWREVVKIAKLDIVIRTPAVLVGNIASNIMLCMQFGMSPKEVVKLQIEGVKELEQYRQNKEKLDKLVLQKQVSKDSGLNNKIDRLQSKINRSPVKPLIDAGFFTYIMEDIDTYESKSSSTISRWIDKKLDNKPEGVKTVANYLYFTERTAPFQFMLKATQNSDFAARYAMYHANKRKIDAMDISTEVKNKMVEELLKQTRDAFINYGKLDNKVLKYANDMGLVMFTKFLVGSQRTIKMLIKGRPVNALLVGAAQSITGNIDDVIDHNIVEYDFGRLLYDPTRIIKSATVPTLFEVPSLLEQATHITKK